MWYPVQCGHLRADQLHVLRVERARLGNRALVQQVGDEHLGALPHPLEDERDPAVLLLDILHPFFRGPLCTNLHNVGELLLELVPG
jgi:hypothetical protein